ncbi:hypothetical protein IP81_12425 [Novosphingobium sp. AAP83]|uniref:hypothetical protein n=1 Tax=Novosphingobium sp. AAP83 TaxID=1523425 RepID=UPI0006B98962|nr:hypothetical protein [Novosphingobium sp. AAP83]KPF91017.1 hypothetical protein IP81_12425 [Novosphingobium sp. AAP83]
MEDWFVHIWQYHAALGAMAFGIALCAVRGERRRLRRTNLDAVGFMPWTVIYLISFLAAIILLGLAAREWFAV